MIDDEDYQRDAEADYSITECEKQYSLERISALIDRIFRPVVKEAGQEIILFGKDGKGKDVIIQAPVCSFYHKSKNNES